MSEWNFMDFASKENLLRTVRQQSDEMIAMASAPESWEAPTAAGHWEVRDVIGHLVDTTEGYFAGWGAAAGNGTVPDALGVKGMDKHVDDGATAFRDTPQDEMLQRLEKDRAEMLAMIEGLDADAWGGFIVPHKYMGPLPAFFYPVAQLVDYTVHSWDIRQGSGRSHAMDGDAADLLVPFCFIVWQSTAECVSVDPFTLGVRLSGNNGGETRVTVSPEGVGLEPGDVGDLPLVIDFDPASFVLTAMGRINGGTARGDTRIADRFCNLFFRI
ncbi:MAG TPA: maleylpyruvate isomerase family mycothiol-dependent enzyme [Acidimicrobiales bacterium]